MARLSLLGVLLLAVAPLPTTAQLLTHRCFVSNYAANSTFQSNLNAILSSLPANGYAAGFFNGTVGDAPDRVYGLVLCRGDVSKADCRTCLDTVAQDVLQLCPGRRAAIVWYRHCMLRYTDRQLSSAEDLPMYAPMWSVRNLTEVTHFKQQLDLLMGKLVSYATENTWAHMFATGEAAYVDPKNPKIYGLVQCAMYQSADDCKFCLNWGINNMPNWASGKAGALYLTKTCNIMYSLYSFYQGSPMVSVPLSANAPVLQPAASELQPPAESPRPSLSDNQPPKGRRAVQRVLYFLLSPSLWVQLLPS